MSEFANPNENKGESDLESRVKRAFEELKNRDIVLDMVAPRRKDYYKRKRAELEAKFRKEIGDQKYNELARNVGLKGVEFGYVSTDHERGMGYIEIKETNPTDERGRWRLALVAMARINIPMKAYWALRGDSFNQENELEFDTQKSDTISEQKADPVAQMQWEQERVNQKQRNLDEKISQLQMQARTLSEILSSILNKLGFEDTNALYEDQKTKTTIPRPQEGDDEDRGTRLLRAHGKIIEQDTLVALSFRRKFQTEKLE